MRSQLLVEPLSKRLWGPDMPTIERADLIADLLGCTQFIWWIKRRRIS